MSASAITSAFATSTSAPPIRLTDIDKLKGSVNYKPWSLLIRQYLRVTDTWTIVEGKQAKPTTPADDVAKWLQADAAAKLILLQTIDVSLLHLIEDDSLTSAASWSKLEANYAAASTLTTYYKFRDYFSTAIDGSAPLAEELEKRGRLWQEVDNSGILAKK